MFWYTVVSCDTNAPIYLFSNMKLGARLFIAKYSYVCSSCRSLDITLKPFLRVDMHLYYRSLEGVMGALLLPAALHSEYRRTPGYWSTDVLKLQHWNSLFSTKFPQLFNLSEVFVNIFMYTGKFYIDIRVFG